MEYFLEIAFSGFWQFIGCWILLLIPAQLIVAILNTPVKLLNRTFRHWNIRKHGYPPVHCDADGDFKKTEEK